jgi:hypothetical protein
MIEQYQSTALHKTSSGFSSFQTVQLPSRHASSFKISLDPKCERLSSGGHSPSSKNLPAPPDTSSPSTNKGQLRKPRHPHDSPDENYLFRIFTPGEYDALRDADNNWRVTTSSDISGSWDGIPFAADEYRSGNHKKWMGRPPKTKLPRHSLTVFDARPSPKKSVPPPESGRSQKLRFAPPCGIETPLSKPDNHSVISRSGPITVTSLIDPVTHAYIRNPGGAALWAWTTNTSNEYRLMINVARISDLKPTMASLLCFLNEGWHGLRVFQVNCEPSLDSNNFILNTAWEDDESTNQRPTTLSRRPFLIINKDILQKYTIRAYKEDAYDSNLNGPREQISWVPEWYSISLTVLPFVYPTVHSSSMENDVTLRMLVDTVVRQYMICGNAYHALLYRTTVLEKLEKLDDPLQDSLICAIVAGKANFILPTIHVN